MIFYIILGILCFAAIIYIIVSASISCKYDRALMIISVSILAFTMVFALVDHHIGITVLDTIGSYGTITDKYTSTVKSGNQRHTKYNLEIIIADGTVEKEYVTYSQYCSNKVGDLKECDFIYYTTSITKIDFVRYQVNWD